MSARLPILRTGFVVGVVCVSLGVARAPTGTAAPPGIDPTVPVLQAVGGFRATISWGNTEDGEPVTLHLEIDEKGLFPPQGHQIADDLVLCEDGQPTARVNSFVYLRERFQHPVVDVFVDWQEYCSGDPYDGDTVEYTVVITQLPEYSPNGEATPLKRITGRFVPTYRGDYSMGLEDHIARVEVAPAPAGNGSGGGSSTATTIGVIALVAVGAGGAATIIRRVRRGPGTEIDGLRRQIEALRHHRQQLEQELDRVRATIDALDAQIAAYTTVLLGVQEQLRAAQRDAAMSDTRRNHLGLWPAVIVTTYWTLRPPRFVRTPAEEKAFAIVSGFIISVISALVSWDSATVPPQVTAALDAAQQRLDEARIQRSREVGRERELGDQIVTVDRQITELEARQQALMTHYPGTPPAR